MHAANELSGDERYDAFQRTSSTISCATPRRGRPCGTYNNRYFFSRRIGCHHYQRAYGIDLAQLCVRPAITTDDTIAYEPDRGRPSSTCPCA